MTKFMYVIRLVLFLLFYLTIVVYTLIFPTNASWFIFYALTLWIISSFLSTRQSYHLTHTERIKKDDNRFSFAFTIQNKRRYPFFLSAVKINLLLNNTQQTFYTSTLFSRQIDSEFQAVVLPRGHHDTLTLEITAIGLFGVWKKHSQLTVPINIDVYPTILKKSERDKLMHTLTAHFTQTSRSFNHDYYMNEIRSFQNRDSLAGIDWKASLKRGQWMVKEYEAEEEAPVDFYFIGFNTTSFEDLLSLGYSLLQDLKATRKVNIFLIGRFENKVIVKTTEDSFLTIEPIKSQHELTEVTRSVLNKHSSKIIIKSREVQIPLPLNAHLDHRFIDEDTLLQVKGGRLNAADHKKQTGA
ncbi:DUF58 domain-containing protein [Alkalibacterium sp. 20]|uniref:DUF58 domain-containing protein n=1 Tax=Alkalibacterium sp. 20 TaxID=1798803 RepID=UPI00091DDA38|nr:DUF58 domain-containing protein [Alkalibacterium sp. 20]OJF90137.1 hypothetical protein AX762_04500 [Alkalibacterium sp. 20]